MVIILSRGFVIKSIPKPSWENDELAYTLSLIFRIVTGFGVDGDIVSS